MTTISALPGAALRPRGATPAASGGTGFGAVLADLAAGTSPGSTRVTTSPPDEAAPGLDGASDAEGLGAVPSAAERTLLGLARASRQDLPADRTVEQADVTPAGDAAEVAPGSALPVTVLAGTVDGTDPVAGLGGTGSAAVAAAGLAAPAATGTPERLLGSPDEPTSDGSPGAGRTSLAPQTAGAADAGGPTGAGSSPSASGTSTAAAGEARVDGAVPGTGPAAVTGGTSGTSVGPAAPVRPGASVGGGDAPLGSGALVAPGTPVVAGAAPTAPTSTAATSTAPTSTTADPLGAGSPATPTATDALAPSSPGTAATSAPPMSSTPAQLGAEQTVSPAAPVAAPATVTVPAAPAAAAAPLPAPPATQVLTLLAPVLEGPDGSYSLSLQLYPEELGAVQVDVLLRGGEIRLALHATDDAAQQVLRAALSDLRADLSAAGLSATQLSVDGGRSEQHGSQHQARQQDRLPRSYGQQSRSDDGTGSPPTSPTTSVTDAALDLRM